jgi:hypothetical protein
MLVTKFVELDAMLLDIQDSPGMASVVTEYTEVIKGGQCLLLAKIKRLRGEETRVLVRRAVQASRRRRAAVLQQQARVVPQQPVEEGDESEEAAGELIEPPSNGGLSNRRIMHELALDPNFQLSQPEKTDEQKHREQHRKSVYYNALRTSLHENDQSLLPGLVHDIKSRLLGLLQSTTPSYTTLSSHLDETLVTQQCAHNIFDAAAFLSYVQDMMKRLCAPVRDDQVSAIETLRGDNDVETFILRVDGTIEMLSVMALDSANFHFNLARPTLVSQALAYERTRFLDDLQNGTVKLDKTRTWLQQHITTDDSVSRTTSVFHRAFVNLLFSAEDIPETFPFDKDRISVLRTQIRETIVLAALILLSKTFTAGANSRSLDFNALSRRLKILLSDPPENIFAEIERFVGSPLSRTTLMLNMIRRVKFDERDPCVLLLQKRVRIVLLRVLAGGEGGVLTAMGLAEVEGELVGLYKVVDKVGRVNWGRYGGLYQGIVRELVEGNRESGRTE